MRLLAVLGLNKVPGREVPLGLAALSLGAAAIHFAVISDHFAEYWLFGLFFALVGWYQAGWAVLYALRPSGFLGFTAIVVNAGTIGLWAWTRTIGLPIGPHAGELEAIAPVDVGATAFEIAIVIGLLILARRPSGNHSSPGAIGRRLAALIVFVVAVAAVTTFVIAMDKPAASASSTVRDVPRITIAFEAAQLPGLGGTAEP